MANGHGGPRPGAGRKPKSAAARALDGNANHRGRVLPHPSVPAAPVAQPTPVVDEFDAPDALTTDERLVWLRQAPFAFANGTLTRASALAFERYCQLVIRERAESKSSGCDGANHRGMQKTLNTLELQFKLTPCGKAMDGAASAAESAVDPLKSKYLA